MLNQLLIPTYAGVTLPCAGRFRENRGTPGKKCRRIGRKCGTFRKFRGSFQKFRGTSLTPYRPRHPPAPSPGMEKRTNPPPILRHCTCRTATLAPIRGTRFSLFCTFSAQATHFLTKPLVEFLRFFFLLFMKLGIFAEILVFILSFRK